MPPNTKPTQDTEETSPEEARDQKQRNCDPMAREESLKHSKLDKLKRQRTIAQMKKQGKNP